MASQAPSPSGPEQADGQAEEQTPAAQGAAGGTDAPGGSQPGEAAPVAEKAPRQRKQSLPGVMTRDDGDDIFPDLGFKGKGGKRVSREKAMKELDAELREEKGTGIFDVPPPPVEPEVEEAAKPPQPKAKFKFADKEYESQEAAEQSIKSLQGMFKPLTERAEKAEELARQWYDYANAQKQAPQPQVQQQPEVRQQPTQETAQAELEKALSKVDGNLFESLAREHGLPLAGRYLAAQVLATVHDEMLPALREEIMKQLQPELEPIRQDRGFQQATQHVAGLMDQVAEYKTQDGEIAFPELQSAETTMQIGELWRSLNLPPEVALTPQGLLQAIALYRMYNGAPSQSATPTPTVNVPRPAQTAPRAAAASLEDAGAPSPASERAGSGGFAARFSRELDASPLVDANLGFAVRRRR